MRALFGVPVGTLTVILAVLLAAAFGLLAVLAVRNRVFVRLGVRNLPRRPARTAIIVGGLMLATAIIGSALVTGDTMSTTIRSVVVSSLGSTDELVSVGGTQGSAAGPFDPASARPWFPVADADRVAAALAGNPLVDGVAPAVIESVAVQDRTSRQNEPRVVLFGSAGLDGFSAITDTGGGRVSLDDLGAGEAYLTTAGADDLRASAGDELVVLAGAQVTQLRVRGIVRFHGAGTSGGALLVPLAAAQQLFGRPGEVQHVIVSNAGGETGGVGHTDAVAAALEPVVGPLGLEVQPVKADGLELADANGDTFLSMFASFGTFTITAGILLIFLIFVMLAAERRSEMGTARAIGTQRGHLVQMFVFEGAAYDLLAAAVGAALGVLLSYGVVVLIADAFESTGLEIRHTVRPQSLVLAYALGVLLTLAVVAVSAWRVSRLNVSAAIRNLPDPLSHRRRGRRWRLGLVGVAVGVLLTVAGYSSAQGTPFLLGVSLVLASAAPIAIGLRVPDRVAYTTAGIAIVVWWLLPFSVYEQLVDGLSMNFSVWVVGGLMVVLGATWTVVYNADLVLAAAMAVFGRFRRLAPVLKTSIAYPLRNRFRTGVTLAMFTLVVFTLVSGFTISKAVLAALDDDELYGGGFQVRAETPAAGALDLAAALPAVGGIEPAAAEAVGTQSFVPVDASQVGAGREPEEYALRGLDDGFLRHTTFQMAAVARGYADSRAVWDALATNPALAVIDPLVVPRRSNYSFGIVPAFRLSGFLLEDEIFDAVPVRVTDPETGTTLDLTVIGVLSDTAPLTMAGLSTSQQALAPFGERAVPTVHHVALRPGTDAVAFAAALESAFLANGMEAKAVSELLRDQVGASASFQNLVMWYLGLGLVIGVVALGVISARAVVERRQQIGVLRSIGFQRSMVQASFLLESSFVSLLAIMMGTSLALVMAYNVVVDQRSIPSWEAIEFRVPWPWLLAVFGLVYVASLLAAALPARRAARTYPAEALRYE